jgi:hypothetical protein
MGGKEIRFQILQSSSGLQDRQKVFEGIHRPYEVGEDSNLYPRIVEDIGERPFGSGKHRDPVAVGEKPISHVPHMDLCSSDGIGSSNDEGDVHICKVASFRYCIKGNEYVGCMY